MLPPLLLLPYVSSECHFICIYDVCHDVADSWGARVPVNTLKSKEACGSRIRSGKNLDIPKSSDFPPLLFKVTHPNHVLCVQLLLGFAIVDFHGTS